MQKKYFIVLTGAKKNAGDFLITERALVLLKKISPQFDYIKRPSWQTLTDTREINNSQGIIILGGPGFQTNMYPGVYKLRQNLEEIKVPIYPLGLGWYGRKGDYTTEKLYKFNKSTSILLDMIEKSNPGMSCRDFQTCRVLQNNGYKNISMTGCPVWFDLDSLGRKFVAPKSIKKIIITPAQRIKYAEQSMDMLALIKKTYKDAEIIVSFHRGIGKADDYTTEADAINTKKISDYAKSLNLKVIDVSYGSDRLKIYDECDLHIGYRVHAHLYFLSKRLPSILIHEDGRGRGVTETLKSPGIDGYKINKFYSRVFNLFLKNIIILKLYDRLYLKNNAGAVEELGKVINQLQKHNYGSYEKVVQKIDETYPVMEHYILSITKDI